MDESPSLRIIRQRMFFEHPSPTERIVTDEYTLVNESGCSVKDIFLVDLPLMLGLEIFDGEGRSLPFLPNNMVQEKLKPFLQDGSFPDLMEQIFQPGEPYVLWIALTQNQIIRPNEYKIIKLRYRDKKDASGIPSIWARFFTIKRYKIRIQKRPKERYDLFVNISAPLGFEVKYDTQKSDVVFSKSGGFRRNELKEYIQLRIPPDDKPINADIEYDVLPARLEKRFVSITLVSLYITAITLLSLTLLALFTSVEDVTDIINYLPEAIQAQMVHTAKSILDKTFEISAGIIAASAAIAGIIRDPLISRVRLFYLGCAAIATAAFIIHG